MASVYLPTVVLILAKVIRPAPTKSIITGSGKAAVTGTITAIGHVPRRIRYKGIITKNRDLFILCGIVLDYFGSRIHASSETSAGRGGYFRATAVSGSQIAIDYIDKTLSFSGPKKHKADALSFQGTLLLYLQLSDHSSQSVVAETFHG